ELDLTEVARVVFGNMRGGKVELLWTPHPINWPKDWAKLLMNTITIATDCLPRGGKVEVDIPADAPPQFRLTAKGSTARINAEVEHALMGEPTGALDGRSIQAYLTHQLAKGVNAGLNVQVGEGEVRFTAG